MQYSLLTVQGQAADRFHHSQRELNLKTAFDLIRSQRCASRSELVRTMNLSTTAISSIVDELIAERLVMERSPMYSPQPGRRPMRLCLNGKGRQMVTFSLCNQTIRYTLSDMENALIEDFVIDFPPEAGRSEDADDGIAFTDLFEDVLLRRSKRIRLENVIAICISFPGIYLAEKEMFSIRSAMNISFSEKSMREFQQRMGIPSFLANSSMCLAYAEKKQLDHRNDTRNLIYINISDGVGAGIIADGNLLTGTYNTAGEIGHISVDTRGVPCSCGNVDCLERYVSFEAILRQVRCACEEIGIAPPDSFDQMAKEYLHLRCVDAVMDCVAGYLGKVIYPLICVTGIQQIVLGGGIEVLGDAFLQKVIRSVDPGRILVSHLSITYAATGKAQEYVGITQYFLDKEFLLS